MVTLLRYLPPQPGRPRGDQRWATFLRNHADAIVACDFFVAVTAHPTAAWTVQQLREVVGFDRAQVAAAQPAGQCDLRTGDRNDSTRVPGLVDPAVGVASAIDH
jgi:hypothetical protein